MSSVSPAARDLSTLLNDHRLPNTLNYTNDATTGTSRMSDAACERISERVRMVASPTLHAQYLQPLLQQYTSLLSRTAKESLSARFKRTTEDAQVEAEKQKLSGEMGLSHYVKSYLIDPLNALLREEPLAGLRLYWRFLGTGTAGRPDIELVFEDNGGEHVLAVYEIKTSKAVSNTDVGEMIAEIANGALSVNDSGRVCDENGTTESVKCEVTTQVSDIN